jgi:dihydroorotate dehydrogenase electron transfer subunit
MLTDFMGGEKPFSISDHGLIDGKCRLSVTVKRIGEFTNRLFSRKTGDFLSIRGAYGSSFFIPGIGDSFCPEASGFRPVLCGGGFGLPPLYLLARHLLKAGVPAEQIEVISAGRTEKDLLFEDRFHKLGLSYTGAAEALNTATLPDGCGRLCGTAADALSEIIKYQQSGNAGSKFVYASGPDLMMKSLIPHIPEDAEYQFLFERYMKCAIGICGSCVSDPGGIRICKEGPALWRTQVETLEDFGVYKRTASGSIEYFTNRMADGETR